MAIFAVDSKKISRYNQGDHSVRKVRKVRIGQEKEGFFKVVRINAENWPKKSGFLRTLAWSGSKSGFHPYSNLFMAVLQFYPVRILSDLHGHHYLLETSF